MVDLAGIHAAMQGDGLLESVATVPRSRRPRSRARAPGRAVASGLPRLAVLVIASAIACQGDPTPVTYEAHFTAAPGLPTGVELVGPEGVIGALPATVGESLVVELRGEAVDGHAIEQPPPVRARLLRPCGWHEWSLDWSRAISLDIYPPEKTVEIGGKPAMSISVDADVADAAVGARERNRIWVDNRGQGRTRLEIGALSYPVGAGVFVELSTLVPDCAEGAEVRLRGERIGKLPPEAGSFLVDASGERCYDLNVIPYVFGNVVFVNGPPVERSYDLAEHRLYKLFGPIDYAFRAIPDEVTMLRNPDDEPVEKIYQLLERRCPSLELSDED